MSSSSGDDARRRTWQGALLLLGTAFAFSIMSLLVKLAGENLHSQMMVLARGVVTLLISYVWLRATRVSPWGNDRRKLLLAGSFGFGGLSCFFFAITRLPLAEVTVLHYLNPVLTAVLAALFLREKASARLWLALALSLGGVVLVVQPASLFAGGGANLDPLGMIAAVVGASFAASAYTTVRSLRHSDVPLVVVFYFSLVAVPASLPTVIATWVWPTPAELLLLLGIGVATLIGQVWMTRGLTLLPAGPATAIGYTQILFASAWGMVLFGERPGAATLAGAVVILAGTFLAMRAAASR